MPSQFVHPRRFTAFHSWSSAVSFLALWFLAGAFLAGCGPREEITQYQAPKETQPQPPAPDNTANADGSGSTPTADVPTADVPTTDTPATTEGGSDRMLGAMVPQGPRTWFFKMTGPDEAVAARRDEFKAFIQSMTFGEDGPSWTLPDGWSEQPGAGMRYATININVGGNDTGGGALEMSVIPLPTAGDDLDDYLLSNANRWRGQIGLPQINAEQFADEATEGIIRLELPDGGGEATLVDFAGKMSANTMGRPPFARP